MMDLSLAVWQTFVRLECLVVVGVKLWVLVKVRQKRVLGTG